MLIFNDIQNNIKNKKLNFYNFYNLDIDPELLQTLEYYKLSKENIETPQNISTIFLDIEVYQQDKDLLFNFNESLHPISAISFNYKDTYYSFLLDLYDKKLNQLEIETYFKKELILSKYITDDDTIKVEIFTDELTLIKKTWNIIKELDPLVLSGWNCDKFDFIYIYRRILTLLHGDIDETNSILSKFNFVELSNETIVIPDYTICDLMYLYKPRDDGGRNYGESQQSYSLDWISDYELKLKKFSYKTKYFNLNEFYEKDPVDYLLYNLIDVILCVKLNNKLKHIDLHNSIRRTMFCPFNKSLIGSSKIFDSYILNKLDSYIRYGLTTQNSKHIPIESLNNFQKLRLNDKKGTLIQPIEIDIELYNKFVHKYDGAYVNTPSPKIISTGLTFSLDATSMYPSMMLQYNISFDTLITKILPSWIYKFLNTLELTVGTTKLIPNDLYKSIFDIVNKYIENSSNLQNKSEARSIIFYTIIYLLDKIYGSNTPISKIFNPINDDVQYLLSFNLIHVLNLLLTIHPNKQIFNDIIYSYLFDDYNIFFEKYKFIYIIQNIETPNEKIIKLNNKETIDYISKYIITITGSCFEKHNNKIGIFTEMLHNFSILRKKNQKLMDTVDKNSPEYHLYNNRQLVYKKISNSAYGIQGLKTFRFSNSNIANTITSQGKLTNKLAQYISNLYINQNLN